jgi:hypothetical protein
MDGVFDQEISRSNEPNHGVITQNMKERAPRNAGRYNS